jgi:lantibiotic modifying enzyme
VKEKHEYELSARAALVTLLRQIKEPPEMPLIGSFSGLGGILYVLCHLSALWNESGLLDEAEKFVEKFPALIDRDACIQYKTPLSEELHCCILLLTKKPINSFKRLPRPIRGVPWRTGDRP